MLNWRKSRKTNQEKQVEFRARLALTIIYAARCQGEPGLYGLDLVRRRPDVFSRSRVYIDLEGLVKAGRLLATLDNGRRRYSITEAGQKFIEGNK